MSGMYDLYPGRCGGLSHVQKAGRHNHGIGYGQEGNRLEGVCIDDCILGCSRRLYMVGIFKRVTRLQQTVLKTVTIRFKRILPKYSGIYRIEKTGRAFENHSCASVVSLFRICEIEALSCSCCRDIHEP